MRGQVDCGPTGAGHEDDGILGMDWSPLNKGRKWHRLAPVVDSEAAETYYQQASAIM